MTFLWSVSALLIIIVELPQGQQTNCTLPPYQDAFIFDDKNYGLRYYSNINLSSTILTPKPTKAIIVIHGGDRNADDYYCAMFHSAQLEGYTVTNQDIIIIAPRFMEQSDNPNSDELYWASDKTDSNIGWRGCGNSVQPKSNIQNQVHPSKCQSHVSTAMYKL